MAAFSLSILLKMDKVLTGRMLHPQNNTGSAMVSQECSAAEKPSFWATAVAAEGHLLELPAPDGGQA